MMRFTTCLTACVFLAACSPQDGPDTADGERPALGLGVDLDNMDREVRPQDDFFRYVNGTWLEQTEIPSDRSRWGSFDELREAAEEHVMEIINEAAAVEDAEPGSDAQKVGDMYRSFMDTERVEGLGLEPLEWDLAAIDALDSHEALALYWGTARLTGDTAPVGLFVSQDQRQSDRYLTSVTQSGLGLPDREYYLEDSERSETIRGQYVDFIAGLFELAGFEDGEGAAQRILELETRIAGSHWTRVQNRDRNATYNKMAIEALEVEAPGFPWRAYIETAGAAGIEEVNVRQPDYFTALAGFYRDIPVSHWREYHRFHLLRGNAGYLPDAFVDAHFDFYGRILSGQPENRTREKRAVSAVERVLGFMVGQMYVERHFQPEAKERMDEMVSNLKLAFADSIDALEWMTEETKEEARAKLASFNTKIGYPDEWRDYDCVEIHADDLVGNIRRSAECEYERMLSRLGQEVDREEWFMTPQTVNAYYSSTMNEIVFPAAILQPPFFNVQADDAVNYGAIGAVIGHEITHGFDDQGRRSDGDGNLRDWWTEEDEERFNERARKMVEQYNAYNPIDDMHINGELALGENIADLGGMNVAYRAYLHSLGGEEAPVIEGYTGPQRFFMGWGQVWRTKFRDEALRRQLMTGPHSPAEYRVKGVLSNMPEFYAAFGVEEGDPMWRPEEDRVRIW